MSSPAQSIFRADAQDFSDRARAGRDAALPKWLRAGDVAEAPNFDSAVIRGNGVSALACAGRLARSESFAGRVMLAASPAVETPKLINGCTLRARSLDYFAAALGCSNERVLDAIFGPGGPRPAANSQYFSLFRKSAAGEYEVVKAQEFMPARKDGAPFAYATRNGRLVGALAELLAEHGVTWSGESADSLDECRELAPGRNPILINGGHTPLKGAPKTDPPTCFVVAYQCAMRRGKSWLSDDTSLIAGIHHKSCTDIGVYYPFADPLTPDADAYGLFYRIVRPDAGISKDAAIAEMRDETLGVGRTLGWEPVDEEVTGAGALIPGFSWRDVETSLDGYLDLHRTMSSGIPIITGCGMSRAGLAGWVAAEAILTGRDAGPIVNGSLKHWRRLNRFFSWGMDGLSGVFEPALRRAPGLAVRLVADRPDVWAGVAA